MLIQEVKRQTLIKGRGSCWFSAALFSRGGPWGGGRFPLPNRPSRSTQGRWPVSAAPPGPAKTSLLIIILHMHHYMEPILQLEWLKTKTSLKPSNSSPTVLNPLPPDFILPTADTDTDTWTCSNYSTPLIVNNVSGIFKLNSSWDNTSCNLERKARCMHPQAAPLQQAPSTWDQGLTKLITIPIMWGTAAFTISISKTIPSTWGSIWTRARARSGTRAVKRWPGRAIVFTPRASRPRWIARGESIASRFFFIWLATSAWLCDSTSNIGPPPFWYVIDGRLTVPSQITVQPHQEILESPALIYLQRLLSSRQSLKLQESTSQ